MYKKKENHKINFSMHQKRVLDLTKSKLIWFFFNQNYVNKLPISIISLDLHCLEYRKYTDNPTFDFSHLIDLVKW